MNSIFDLADASLSIASDNFGIDIKIYRKNDVIISTYLKIKYKLMVYLITIVCKSDHILLI